jgi:hypothetical protein
MSEELPRIKGCCKDCKHFDGKECEYASYGRREVSIDHYCSDFSEGKMTNCEKAVNNGCYYLYAGKKIIGIQESCGFQRRELISPTSFRVGYCEGDDGNQGFSWDGIFTEEEYGKIWFLTEDDAQMALIKMLTEAKK